MVNPYLPKVAFTFQDVAKAGPCWWYRTELPRRYLEARGWQVSNNSPMAADIVHVARSRSTSYVDVIRAMKDAGKKVIYEVDDDYWLSNNLATTRGNWPSYVNTINRTIDLCDAVIVTTQPLASTVSEVTGKPTYVAPNFLCAKSWGKPRIIPGLGKRPVLLVSGSPVHISDFHILSEIARQSSMRHFQWVFFGSDTFKQVIPSSILLPPVMIDHYFGILQSLGKLTNVLGVVPLLDTLFNKSRSKLKWMEYTYAGIPGIYSNLAEYPGYANYTVSGGATAKQWAEQIIDAYERREEILAEDTQRLTEVGYMDTGIRYWEDIFLRVMHG